MKATPLMVVCVLVILSPCAGAADRDRSTSGTQAADVDPSTVNFQAVALAAERSDFAGSPLEAPDAPPSELSGGEEICQPEIVDSRAALNPSCLNLIEDLHKRGDRIDASTREKHEMPSLCDSMWLPRCRHKY